MLSRIAVQSARPIAALQSVRPVQTSSTKTSEVASASVAPVVQFKGPNEGVERDHVGFPRPLRPVNPGKVRVGFVPEEWFTFFYNKTGVTGPYVLGAGALTFLLSKEIYVVEHEFYTGVAIAIMGTYGVKKFGKQIADYADKGIGEIEQSFKEYQDSSKIGFEEAITLEERAQKSAEAQIMLFQAKRENVQFQLEAAYRARLHHVNNEIKKRLDYHLETERAQRQIKQKNMVDWIVRNVMKSITPEQERLMLSKCISDLKAMSIKA
uniref:ATP synthase subunit b n=1 Tax=Artemia franciscana TaxID=6661 RepID=UPI003B642BA6